MEKIITHLNKSLTIRLHDEPKNETISSDIQNSGTFFEIGFLEFVRNNFGKQKTIIDIGANIGNHSLFFSEFIEHDNLICFEPFEKNVALLRLNLADYKCTIMDYALGDECSEKTLYNSESHNYGGFSLHCYENKSYVVQHGITTKTLDSLNINDITMIKIDVEGYENHVLNGAIETINRNRPMIFIENLSYGFPHLFKDNQFDDFFQGLDYTRVYKNIANSFIDLWVSRGNT